MRTGGIVLQVVALQWRLWAEGMRSELDSDGLMTGGGGQRRLKQKASRRPPPGRLGGAEDSSHC